MTRENRETMQRAIGLIEGIARCVREEVACALLDAAELLDCVLEDNE